VENIKQDLTMIIVDNNTGKQIIKTAAFLAYYPAHIQEYPGAFEGLIQDITVKDVVNITCNLNEYVQEAYKIINVENDSPGEEIDEDEEES
jgi:hypothetical protein